MCNILVFGSNSFIKKNFIKILKERELIKHVKPFFVKDEEKLNFKLADLQKKNLFCIIFSGKSGSIQYNLNNGKKIYKYNKKIYKELLFKLDKLNFKNVFFISASCVYPKNKKILRENTYGQGPFEKSSEFYSKSKVYGSNICKKINKKNERYYITLVPSTLYGEFYKYNKTKSHVLISLLHKFKNLKKISLWGTGKPVRQFLNIQDLFKAIIFIYEKKPQKDIINVTNLTEISIKNLAKKIKRFSKYKGILHWDTTKQDGAIRKSLDDTFLRKLGWKNSHNLDNDLQSLLKK